MRRFAAAAAAALGIVMFGAAANGATMKLQYDGAIHMYNEADINLVINGKQIVTKEMPPISINGRTLVPVREVFESIGGEVYWLEDTDQTVIYYNGNELLFTIDSHDIYLGRSVVSIPSNEPAPKVINGKTMVPIRVVADLLGFSVSWNEASRTVVLSDSDQGVSAPEDKGSQSALAGIDTVVDLDSKNGGNNITKVVPTPAGTADLVYLAYGSPTAPKIYRYNSPERVVLDFPGAVLTEDGFTKTFENGVCISSVRGANHEAMARIVLDVKRQPNVRVARSATGVVIAVSPSTSTAQTVIDDLSSGQLFDQGAYLADIGQSNIMSGSGGTGGGYGGNSGVSMDTSGTVDTTNTVKLDYGAIVLDPGHGGTDPGAEGGGAQEDDINLAVALKVRDKLQAAGYNVIMTRSTDTHVSLQARVDIASRNTGGGAIPALFVSIHSNSFDNPASNGTQVYYHPDSKYGTILAQNIYNQNVANTTLRPGQIHDGSHLYVIRKTLQPAALVEMAFISNASDRAYLTSESGREALATGITAGIIQTMERMKSDKGY